MTKYTDHGEQTKRNIASKAKKLFELKGYSATTMDEIRLLSGSSKGSIYHHFKNKESLFLYILELSMLEWTGKWQEIEKPLSTAREKLYRLAEHYAQDFRNPLLRAAEEFSGSQNGDREILDKLQALTSMHYPIFERLLEEGIRSREFRPIPLEDLTLIVHGLVVGLGLSSYDTYKGERIVGLYRTAIDLLLQGIAMQ
ncbi:TetR/AcrR family transcriptional regulator [Paenibacillus pabuli]|uniref:TetR/AcrR family transcriptional regulator n=1 Tax=Paenibacillus pabuli TaxID=1472 RepID=UPI001FFF2682|nr:TetR/AcrR family transcriptional regulator [Paenibacillus pabuli]UPK43204.1 TetR family transcriptional regulator [Paenibacillus pabuli]